MDPQEELEELVYEYLRFSDQDAKIKSSKKGGAKSNKSPTGGGAPMAKKHKLRLLRNAFDDGDAESFFSLVNQHIPRRKMRYSEELFFNINLYFAIAPIHPFSKLYDRLSGASARQQRYVVAMKRFKGFLERRGKSGDKDPELLVYYGLPFVRTPAEHPSFSHLFSENWLRSLYQDSDRFLVSNTTSTKAPQTPKLLSVFMRLKRESQACRQMQAALENESRKRQNSEDDREVLKRMATKMYELSADLFKKLETAVKRPNHPQADDTYLRLTRNKLTDFNQLISNISARQDHNRSHYDSGSRGSSRSSGRSFGETAVLLASYTSPSPSSAATLKIDNFASSAQLSTAGNWQQNKIQISNDLPTMLSNLPPLDYTAIRSALKRQQQTENADLQTALVLQALRWLLCAPDPAVRKNLLEHFITNDVLGCSEAHSDSSSSSNTGNRISSGGDSGEEDKHAGEQGDNGEREDEGEDESHETNPKSSDRASTGPSAAGIVEQFLSGSVGPLSRESGVRLLNALASYRSGRQYLLQQPSLLPMLLQLAKRQQNDNATRQQCIGALQKFSLRRAPQSVMIRTDVISWSVDLLAEADLLSDYSQEYCSALLMNLSLRSAGKVRCEEDADKILGVLMNLVEHSNPQVRTYVNGTLYSILSRPALRDAAKALGIDRLLEELSSETEPQFQEQIDCILQQLTDSAEAAAAGATLEDASGDDEEEEEEEEEDMGEIEEGERDDELASAIKSENLVGQAVVKQGPALLVSFSSQGGSRAGRRASYPDGVMLS
mmetsp:Transcript_40225/g.79063  ORF Transcript_40225/g.79063 Transcript_40225/m.79063 type:complete len:779 (+) Transcript_40225:51-2387(+)